MRNRKAFTLVELLVVIGIIAVLIGILLPTLGKAREAAKRVQCLSGIRELGNAFRIYATHYKDQIPIGYMDQSNFNYFVVWNNANGAKISMMGLLALDRLIPNPRVFYCPDVQDETFSYNTPSNPWPDFNNPNDPRFTTPGLGHVRIDYMTRPCANWPTNSRVTDKSNPAYWIPYLGTKYTATLDTTKMTVAMPRMAKLKNKAIASDLVYSVPAVKRAHKTGINVLYANGSAQWVDLSRYMGANYKPSMDAGAPISSTNYWWARWYVACGDDSTAVAVGNNDYFLIENDYFGGSQNGVASNTAAAPCGIWANMDRASGGS